MLKSKQMCLKERGESEEQTNHVVTYLVNSKIAGTSSTESAERSASMRNLFIVVALCILFMGIEVVGGIKANSHAILTDAAHLLSDAAVFAISLFCLWAAGWEATTSQSYGLLRVEILGALVSIQMIWLLAGILVYETVVRLIYESGGVNGFLMFPVSAFGLVVNIVMALVLGHDHAHGHGHDHGLSTEHGHQHLDHIHSHCHNGVIVTTNPHLSHDQSEEEHHHDHVEPLLKNSHGDGEHKLTNEHGKKRRNINVQGAYLHVLGDSIQSIGVMIWGRDHSDVQIFSSVLFFQLVI